MKSSVSPPIPFFIVTHNRLTGLMSSLSFLVKQDFPIQIIVADMQSTYPPMVEYLNTLKLQGDLEIWNCANIGPRGLFFDTRFRSYVESKNVGFFLSDGDLDFSETSHSLLSELVLISRRFPGFRKVGAALRLDDLPMTPELLARKSQVIFSGEKRNFFKSREMFPGVFLAPIDTTIAYYPELTTKYYFWPSIRLGGVHAVRHSPWYEDDQKLTEEQSFYLASQRRDISTMGGRQLFESTGSERLLVERISPLIKLVLRIFPRLGSRAIGYVIERTNKNSFLTKP